MPTRSYILDRARTNRVVTYLADHSWSGHVTAETTHEGGEILTVVRRGARSAPWTDQVHAWLKDVLILVPGVVATRTANAQAVTLVWRADQ
jgi:hypothetical protein